MLESEFFTSDETQPMKWLDSLLPIHAITFRMRFIQSSHPGQFHQGALTGWLRTVLGSPADYGDCLSIALLEQQGEFAAGDCYRFTVYGISDRGGYYLSCLPGAILSCQHKWDAAMPFRDNWRLDGLQHFQTGQPYTANESSIVLTLEQLEQQVALLRRYPSIMIHFQSPWRVLRSSQVRLEKKGEKRYCHSGHELCVDNLCLVRLDDSLRKLAEDHGAKLPERCKLPSISLAQDLKWVNASYKNAQGRIQPLGGLIGSLKINDAASLGEHDLRVLLLGQFLGTGQRRVFGNGRYKLIGCGHD